MFKRRTLKTALAAVISLVVVAAPVYANPGNGNGGGHGNGGSNHGNSGNHGNSADHSNKGQGNGKSGEDHGNRKNSENQTTLTPISASRGRAPWQSIMVWWVIRRFPRVSRRI